MQHIRHLFFDLDGTLWDFHRNSYDTLHEIWLNTPQIHRVTVSFDRFVHTYHLINNELWDQYKAGLIDKDFLSVTRFERTLNWFGYFHPTIGKKMGDDYLRLSPLKTQLIDHAIETLEQLKEHYTLHIITNGFTEVQYNKLRKSNLSSYFATVTTSEESGISKPHGGIFSYALSKAGASKDNSLMIGDDIEADIAGAKSVGIRGVLLSSYENHAGDCIVIKNLSELPKILLGHATVLPS
jgi:putative hydrolase of the HAD superfamily